MGNRPQDYVGAPPNVVEGGTVAEIRLRPDGMVRVSAFLRSPEILVCKRARMVADSHLVSCNPRNKRENIDCTDH